MTFSRIVKILIYATIVVFLINRWIFRQPKSHADTTAALPTTAVPEYVKNATDPRALMLGGNKFLEEGKLELAEYSFAKAAKLDPKLRDAQLFLGITRLELKKYFDAEVALRRAKAIDPLYPKTYQYLARLYDETGQREQAEKTRATLQSFHK